MQIHRNILPKIISCLDMEKILIIKGPRQVGKTTLMKSIIERLSDKGETTFYISADEDFDNAVFKTPQHFMARVETEISLTQGKAYLFIDEFQYINNAGKFLKVLYDKYTPGIQFIVSGSSSLEINRSTEFLTGRKIEFLISRIYFTEFVRFHESGLAKAFTTKSFDYQKWKILYEVHTSKLEILFAQYAGFGGYPEIVTTKDYGHKKILMKELFSTYIQKDIIAFLKVSNVSAFNNLVKVLCSETANLLNKQSLAGTLGISINTLNKYLDILQGTYVCCLLAPFYSNMRKEVSKMPKIFINDNGLRNFILNREIQVFNDINGQDAENLVFGALSNQIWPEKLFYYRTISKSEIDFIIDHGESKEAVEVKFQSRACSVPVAMRNFAKKYNTVKFIIITKNVFKESGDTLFLPLPLFEFYLLGV